MHITVIGGGILGYSLAVALMRRNHHVTHISQANDLSHATHNSFSWINSRNKVPNNYHNLNYSGLHYWKNSLANKYPESVSFSGHIEIATSQSHKQRLSKQIDRLRELSYKAEIFTCEEALRTFGDIPAGKSDLIAYFPEEGHAYPLTLINKWKTELEQADNYRFLEDRVISIDTEASSTTTSSNKTISSDKIFVAAGNGTKEILESIGHNLPLVGTEPDSGGLGFLNFVKTTPHKIDKIVTTDILTFRPDGYDGLILQALDLDTYAYGSVNYSKIELEFENRLKKLVPDLELYSHNLRVARRNIPADGLPMLGCVNSCSERNVWVAVTHSGIVLGPWIAQLLADELTEHRMHDNYLQGFRPSRFENSRPSLKYAPPVSPGDQ